MVMVLVLMGVGTALSLSYLYSTSIRMIGSNNFLDATRAQYLAESGVQHALGILWDNPLALENTDSNNPLGPFTTGDGSGDSYRFWMTPVDESAGIYDVFSRASSSGLSRESSLGVLCVRPYDKVVIDSAPAGYWRLGDANNTAVDQMNGRHGVYQGAVPGQVGALVGDDDTAVMFDGSDDYTHIDSTDFMLTGDMTVVMWIKANSFSDNPTLIACGDYGPGGTGRTLFGVGFNDDDIVYKHEDAPGKYRKHRFGMSLNTGRWYQIAVVRKMATKRISVMVNGVPVGDWGYSNHPAYSVAGKLYIGMGAVEKDFLTYFDGLIDEVAIYGRALTSEEIRQQYNSGRRSPAFEVLNFE